MGSNVSTHGPLRRAFRILGRIMLGLLLLLLLATGGGLLWLRSSWSDRVLTEHLPPMLNGILASQGLSLQLEAITGPLPGRLRIQGLRLFDQEGLFLEIPEIEVELHVQDLLDKKVNIELARIAHPALYRLPVLPPPRETPAKENEAPGPGLAVNLPVAIQLHALRLEEGRIPWSLLGQETPAAVSAPAKALALAQTQPLSLDIRANALFDQGELTASLDLDIHDTASAPGSNLSIALKLPSIKALLKTPQDNAANLEGSLAVSLGTLREETAFHLSASLRDDVARLETCSIQGLGLSLEAEASVELDGMRPAASLTLEGREEAAWQELAGIVFGLDQGLARAVGSPLHLRLELKSADDDVQLDMPVLRAGVISGSGTLRLEALIAALTTAVDAPAAGAAAPACIAANAADPKIHASTAPVTGQAGQEPKSAAGLLTQAGQEQEDAAELPVQAGSATNHGMPAPDAPVVLAADFSFTVADISPFDPDLAGSLKSRLQASGTLHDITVSVTAQSASLKTPAGELNNLDATVTAKADTAEDGAIDASGSIRAGAAPDAVGPAEIRADWELSLPGKDISGVYKGPGQAQMRDLRVTVFGLDLNGGIRARFGSALLAGHTPAPSMASPVPLWPGGLALDGSIQARIKDWSPLASLVQTSLQGSEAAANVTLSHAGDRQGLQLDLRLDSFSAPQQGLSLSALSVQADASLPESAGNHPALNLALQSGKGQASDIAWSEIQAKVTGNGPRGDFSVLAKEDFSMHRTTRASKGPSSGGKRQGTQGAGAGSSRAELLSLAGSYDLAAMEIGLNSMVAKEPSSGIGVRIRQPAVISLAQGIAVHGLALDFTPGGSLTAEANLGQDRLQADVSLSALPLEMLNRLGGTSLPAGRLDAGIVLKDSGRGPEGEILADIRFDREQEAFSGKKRMTANAQGDVRTRGRSTQDSQTAATAQNNQATPVQGPADISLSATLGRQGGRLQLDGSLDFSRLADSQNPANQAASPVADAQAPGSGAASTVPSARPARPLHFRIPMLAQGAVPMPDMNGPLDIGLQWTGPLDGLWQLVPLPDTELSGLLSVDISVKGSLSTPKAGGSVYMAGGRFNDKATGVLLRELTLEAHASNTSDFSLIASATDGLQGSMGLEGSLSLKDGPAFTLRGQIKHLSPLHRDDLNLVLTGIFNAAGPLNAPEVSATVVVERGEITLLSTLGGGSVRTLPITDPNAQVSDAPPFGGTLDVTVEVPRRFYIRGRGMDSEWQGKLQVSGPLSEPELTGSLNPVRGYFELLSKPFAFTGGNIVFVGGSRINPGLNLELTYSGPDLEAIITAGGSLEKPSLDLQSRPPLPRDEVLAHVLFGKSVSELSRFEALQLANGLRGLAGIGEGGLDPLTTMRKATGLDVLRVGGGDAQETRQDSGMSGASNLQERSSSSPADESAPSLEAGKYINDSIYIGVEQGATQESTGVRVEIELFPSITVQGKTTSTSSSAGIGWKMDY